MSCNGCRVLRKGCSEGCILRHCLQWIDSPESQAHATLFVTKFFGRAGLTAFINGVPENQRPALFQSLLYEACGRTVNPVYGAVGLLFSGKWAVCQAAVDSVLRGGSPKPAAINISSKHTKPNSTSALTDHPAGSILTLDPLAGFNMTASAAAVNDVKRIQCLPAHYESSLATSSSSFKASSLHTAAKHCVLDFSNYSASSNAEEMTCKGLCFNKRSRDSKPEIIVDEEPMLKRARSSFLNGSSTAAAVGDTCDMTTRRPSITAWIEDFNKDNGRRIGSNDCMLNYDVYAPAGEDNMVLGAAIKQAPHGGLANAPNGLAVQGTHHEQLVAPVARRVYIPPPTKQDLRSYGGVQMSMKRFSNESAARGDDHQARPHMWIGRKEYIPSLSCSVHQDTMQNSCGNAVDIKLNLGLRTQHGELCYNHGELVNIVNSAPDTLELRKHEEPHVLLRMSSPSVNSESSVNTLVGGLDRSSCTALGSSRDGMKLLNLLV